MTSGWPKPNRRNNLSRNAASRRTTCVGPDELAALRQESRFDFDLAGKGLSGLAAGAVEPVVAADDRWHGLRCPKAPTTVLPPSPDTAELCR